MDAIEYLNANVADQYRIDVQWSAPYKITKHERKRYIYDRVGIITENELDEPILLGKVNNSVLGTNYIMSHETTNESIRYILYWLEEKLFRPMLLPNHNISTELVRLRIGTNLILALSDSTMEIERRQQWAEWITTLYWVRRRVLYNWYMKYIAQLPF